MTEFINGIMMLGLFILIWLALRAIVIWYFKIDTIVNELKKLNDTTARMNANLERTLHPPGPGETV